MKNSGFVVGLLSIFCSISRNSRTKGESIEILPPSPQAKTINQLNVQVLK
jgi:hypothetical protein